MEMVDNYGRFLEPDEIEEFSKDKMAAYLNAKCSGKLHQSIMNVEIYKCSYCGSYNVVEYFKEEECFTVIKKNIPQRVNTLCPIYIHLKHDPGLDSKCMRI